MSLHHSKEEEETIPIPPITIKEGTPTKVMLRDFPTFNPGALRSTNIRLLTMDNNGGGAPRTQCMGNLMVCT